MKTANKTLFVLLRVIDALSYLLLFLGGFLFLKILGVGFGSSDKVLNKITLIMGLIAFAPRLAFWITKNIRIDRSNELVLEGDKHFDRQEYLIAISKYDSAITTLTYFGGNPYVLIKRARSSFALGRYEDAAFDAVSFAEVTKIDRSKEISKDEISEAQKFIEELQAAGGYPTKEPQSSTEHDVSLPQKTWTCACGEVNIRSATECRICSRSRPRH